jgi:hypothetical protein
VIDLELSPYDADEERRLCHLAIQRIHERHRIMIDAECKPFTDRLARLPMPRQIIMTDDGPIIFDPPPRDEP